MTTTPAPKGADIERFRPGFEAWARSEGFSIARDSDGKYEYDNDLWETWVAAKRESVSGSSTSTSQGADSALDAMRNKLRTVVYAATAVIERWDSPKWKDEAPTAEYIARLRAAVNEASANSNSGAAPGDALDAARVEFSGQDLIDLQNALMYVEDEGPSAGGGWPSKKVERLRGIVESAIAASTSKGAKP